MSEVPGGPNTPRGDLQSILDALARALVVVIGAAAVFVLAFLANYAALHYSR